MSAAPDFESARVLAIQSVAYQNDVSELLRGAHAAAVSARAAQTAGAIASWLFALGDSSPEPTLDSHAEEQFRETIESAGGRFTYLHFGSNLGHGGGHNRLAKTHSADLIFCLNPDGILGPGAIAALAATVSGDVGAADGRQLPIEQAKDFDAVTGDTSWASGACLMSRGDVFRSLDGFDHSSFFLYGDDVDYSWRVKLAGYRVAYSPSARLFHDKRLTVTADWPATQIELKYSAEAALLLAHKYSRPDLVASLLRTYAEQNEYTRDAAADFERRRAAGSLPDPIDPEHRVAQFVNGNYAVHRY